MLLIRRLHAYIGLFIAPSVLFFSLSGALQLFNLHEAHGRYRPPALIATLGVLHKDQVLSEPNRDVGPPPGAKPVHGDAQAGQPTRGGRDDHDKGPTASALALKWFFEVVTAGLVVSTLFGMWISLRFTRTPRLSWGLAIAGVVVPIFLILL